MTEAAMDGMTAIEARMPERPTVLGTLDGLEEAVIVVDAERRVRVANGAALRLLDLAPTSRTRGPALVTYLRRSALDEPSRERVGDALRHAMALGTDAEEMLNSRKGGRITVSVRRIAARRWRLALRPVPISRAPRSARRDMLTGLADRQTMRTRLGAALTRGSAMLLLLDLDRFKAVNDTLGHPIGDQLLCAAAERMRQAVRARDLVVRLGGDEFAILISDGSTLDQATALAARLVDLLGRPYLLRGNLASVGASVGVAAISEDCRDPDEMMRRADLALYQAKADGRGTVRVFEAAMNERAQSRRALEADIRSALVLRQFTLNYQPQYDMNLGVLVGFEALLRWPHPERGMVSPATFIPISEEIGLISTIGAWVLRQACADAATWSQPLSVAVNVSPLQFERGDELISNVQTALARSGLPARRLEIEITESSLLAAEASTLATLHALRRLGVRVSLDDFGTGYSSLSQLRSFPFDKIKIDRSFVNDVAHSAQASAIIRAISTLGDSLGISTIAEGVETAEQAKTIALNGCSDIQGYLISRPLPMDGVEGLIGQYGTSGRRSSAPEETALQPEEVS